MQMEKKAEYTVLSADRGNLYYLLGRLYETEVDQTLLDEMSGLSSPGKNDGDELAEGLGMLTAYLQNPGLDPLTRLAVDYARVFLGAGLQEGGSAFPYESVYTSPEKLIMQEARDQVVEIYKGKGLGKAETLDFPEDHIALELKFMSRLCQECQNAWEADDWPAAAAGLKEQMDFLNLHLLNWVPEFCADIDRYARTDFYKAVGKITSGFLDLDRTMLEDLITELPQ